MASEPPAADASESGVISLTVTTGGDQHSYRFFEADGQYYVKRDDLDTLFTLSQYDFDRITGVNHEELAAGTGATPDTPAQADEQAGKPDKPMAG